MNYQLVALDVAGTTVEDGGIVLKAFKQAFSGVVPERWAVESQQMLAYAVATMGQSKIEVFSALLDDSELAERANQAFELAYQDQIAAGGAHAIEGAESFIRLVQKLGIPVALTTGFSRTTLNSLLDALGWQDLVDFTVTPTEAGRGRPHADMLEYAAAKFGITDPTNVLVAGDTISDILAGISYGANDVVGVLTGSHDKSQLAKAGAKFVFDSLNDLRTLLV